MFAPQKAHFIICRKKKAKKYVLVACARRPTAASIAAAYYAKQPSKIGNLRPDTLALMLNMANVGAHARVLVIESCGGLVSGAVAERLAGFGTVCSSYVGDTPPRMEVCGSFNFDERTRAAMHATPLVRLLEEVQRRRSSDASVAASDAAGAANGPVQAANTTNAGDSGAVGVTEMNEEAAEVAAGQPPVNQGEDVPMAEPAGSAEKRPTEDPVAELPSGALPAAVAYALPFTSCIIACQGVSPTELLTAVLPLLAPSATFALALPLVAPLAECMEALKDGNLAVNMALQETWLREYQVLPMRTHPLNGMSHGGGYILSGTVTVDGAALPLALPQG